MRLSRRFGLFPPSPQVSHSISIHRSESTTFHFFTKTAFVEDPGLVGHMQPPPDVAVGTKRGRSEQPTVVADVSGGGPEAAVENRVAGATRPLGATGGSARRLLVDDEEEENPNQNCLLREPPPQSGTAAAPGPVVAAQMQATPAAFVAPSPTKKPVAASSSSLRPVVAANVEAASPLRKTMPVGSAAASTSSSAPSPAKAALPAAAAAAPALAGPTLSRQLAEKLRDGSFSLTGFAGWPLPPSAATTSTVEDDDDDDPTTTSPVIDDPVPYSYFADVLSDISATGSRLDCIRHLTYCFYTILCRSNISDLLAAVYLAVNKLAPAHEGMELGIGDAIMIKVVSEVTSKTEKAIKEEYNKKGDLAEIAQEGKRTVKTLFSTAASSTSSAATLSAGKKKPAGLMLSGVLKSFRTLATLSGKDSAKRKQELCLAMLREAKGPEVNFLVRAMQGKMRIGLAEPSVLLALGCAIGMRHFGPSFDDDFKSQPFDTKLMPALQTAVEGVTRFYHECPSYDILLPLIKQHGLRTFTDSTIYEAHLGIRPGLPVKPMLAHATNSVTSIFDRFTGKAFVCEFKYDGERGQIHFDSSGKYLLAATTPTNPTGQGTSSSCAATETTNTTTSFTTTAASSGGGKATVVSATPTLASFFAKAAAKKVATTTASTTTAATDTTTTTGEQPSAKPPVGTSSTTVPSSSSSLPHPLHGCFRIFSRNCENHTEKFPDVIDVLPTAFRNQSSAAAAFEKTANSDTPSSPPPPLVHSFILDSEVVAVDDEGKLQSFQTLQHRQRKVTTAVENIQVQVVVMIFDILFLNGESLLNKSLRERRDIIRQYFVPNDKVRFATGLVSSDVDELQEFLDKSIAAGCEGLMVKTLDVDATYTPLKRSYHWLKLKKDYMEGVGDTLDVVPIGAYHGKGKRTGAFGGYLLAVYDPDSEEFQTICKIGTGFKDEDLNRLTEECTSLIIGGPRPNYRVHDNLKPDVWLSDRFVWEIKCADLTISPVHSAAVGLVDAAKGIALRFPRFLQRREDKGPTDATSASQVANMYRAQALAVADAEARVAAAGDPEDE